MYLLLFGFFFFAIGLSFLCSLWEAVLLSISPAYAEILLEEKTSVGKHLQSFKQKIDVPLSAILSLNTFAHTVGAIGVGEQTTLIWQNTSPWITNILMPLTMTAAILIFSEIIPKTIGANFWKELTPFTVHSLRVVIVIIYPIVWLCQIITKLFRKEGSGIFSRTDFIAMTAMGEKHGIFTPTEADLIENALDLAEVRIQQIMRQKDDMVYIDSKDSLDTILETITKNRYTRYPVYDKDKKDFVGIIHVKDLLIAIKDQQKNLDLASIIRPILKVPEALPTMYVLGRLRAGMPHFALVYDKSRNYTGFVTFDNLLYVILGLIKDEFNKTQNDWSLQPDGSLLVKGSCSLFALERALDTDLDIEDSDKFDNLADIIINEAGTDLKPNQVVSFEDFDAYIVQIQNNQITLLRIIPKLDNDQN